MFAGKQFPSFFEDDLFALRRTNQVGAGVHYDPESLLTGAEEAAGLTYRNSRRNWPDEMTYHEAVSGGLTTLEILTLAPRVALDPWNGIKVPLSHPHYAPGTLVNGRV